MQTRGHGEQTTRRGAKHCGHLLALVGHVCAARPGDLGLRVRHQPLALVLPQDGQEVQTYGRASTVGSPAGALPRDTAGSGDGFKAW